MKNRKKKYKAYQEFYSGKRIIKPGEIVECKEIEARCINFLQPMTLKLIVE